jgi:hypothetical protein
MMPTESLRELEGAITFANHAFDQLKILVRHVLGNNVVKLGQRGSQTLEPAQPINVG